MDLQKYIKKLENPEVTLCKSIDEFKIPLNDKVVWKTVEDIRVATIKEIGKDLKDNYKNNQKVIGLEIKHKNLKLESTIVKDKAKQLTERNLSIGLSKW